MRLDKLLEKAKVGSRGEVKKLLRAQQVRVDGQIVTKANLNVDSNLQEITVSGRVVQVEGEIYLMLNKPAGVVSAVSDKKYQTVIDLIASEDRKDGLYPIGRLDRDTEGLLLLTTNGPLGFRMLHPKHHVEKTYYVEVNGRLGEDAPHFFEKGGVFFRRYALPASETRAFRSWSITKQRTPDHKRGKISPSQKDVSCLRA